MTTEKKTAHDDVEVKVEMRIHDPRRRTAGLLAVPRVGSFNKELNGFVRLLWRPRLSLYRTPEELDAVRRLAAQRVYVAALNTRLYRPPGCLARRPLHAAGVPQTLAAMVLRSPASSFRFDLSDAEKLFQEVAELLRRAREKVIA